MKKNKIVRGYAFVILSAVIFGLMPLITKLIYEDGVNAVTLVFLRNLFALPMLAALALRNDGKIKIKAKEIPEISIISIVGCCATPVLLLSSYNYIPSGTATVFHFIYPAVVVIGSFVFLKEKINSGHVLSVVICMIGIALFYDTSGAINFKGSLFALASGVTYSLYIIMISKFKDKNISVFTFTFFVSAVAAAVMFALCAVTGELAFPESIRGWTLVAAFALFIHVGAMVLFQSGTFLIGGSKASILSTFEPITSVIVGILIFKEQTSALTILGTVLVISASVLITTIDNRQNSKES